MTDQDIPGFISLEEYHKAEERLALQIGRFVMKFAVMETSLNEAIGTILRVPAQYISQVITQPIINVNVRLDILSSLSNSYPLPEALQKRYDSAITKTRNLNDDRNWLVHDQWGGYMPLSDQWQKIKPEVKKKYRTKHKLFSPNEIDKRGKECWDLCGEFQTLSLLYAQWRDAQPTSPEKYP